jgi:hypothetical protein
MGMTRGQVKECTLGLMGCFRFVSCRTNVKFSRHLWGQLAGFLTTKLDAAARAQLPGGHVMVGILEEQEVRCDKWAWHFR